MPDLGLPQYRLLVAACVFLAATHAYLKLSPYFAVTWFGSGLVFGYLWSDGSGRPEVVLLPVLVVYLAAAVTKGLVETRQGVAGNHLVHVLLTGVFAGLLAAPFEAVCERLGFGLAGPLGGEPASWLGGASLRAVAAWALAGCGFYGTYKLLDHVGLGRPLQTVLLFAAVPLLVMLLERASALL